MSCTTELLYPHTGITPEIIMEFFNARAPPIVPASHPRANDPSFTGENLRPFVHREGQYLTIYPADERPVLRIDVMRSLREIMDDVSAFNQEPPFPSFPDPFSPAELTKLADKAFPVCEYFADDYDAGHLWNRSAFEVQAVGGEPGENAQRAAEDGVGAFGLEPIVVDHHIAPAGSAQWHATPAPTSGRPTPLPLYASPDLPEEAEDANEASGSATHMAAQPGPAPDAPLSANHPNATQAPCHSQSVEDAPLPVNDHPAAPAPLHIQPVQDAPLPDNDTHLQALCHTQPAHDAPLSNNDTHASQAPRHSQPAPAVPAPNAMMAPSQFIFRADAGPSTRPATFMNLTPAPAPEVGPTVSHFRASFFSAKEYTGPPEKSARKAPAAKSKSKAAGKSARK